ncbi:MAG TPA: cytochrome c [Solirubrobacterales bacterium]|jgi:mono/diheme cytochrome c family protein|nr:cytochrome c [Solirubrobacterales bacterium]
MSKRVFIVFGMVVLVLAVLIPWLAFRDKGDASTGPQQVAAQYEHGQELFQTNCGTCHTLYSAGTDGNYAPDLDELLAPNGPPEEKATVESTTERVLNAVENGVDSSTTPGRMPAGILNQQQAKEVAEFVGATAGEG